MKKSCTIVCPPVVMYHSLSACMADNPLAKASGLSPRTGGQTMV